MKCTARGINQKTEKQLVGGMVRNSAERNYKKNVLTESY